MVEEEAAGCCEPNGGSACLEEVTVVDEEGVGQCPICYQHSLETVCL